MRRQPDTIKDPTQYAALFGDRRCRQQRWHIGQQCGSRSQVKLLRKRRRQRAHQLLNRSHLCGVFHLRHQPIGIQTRQALFSRLQLRALVVIHSVWVQHHLGLTDDFGSPLRRQSQQPHHIQHLRLDDICAHTWCSTGQPIVPRTAIIAIPATVFGCRRMVCHWAVAVLAVHDLREHPTARRPTPQTNLPVFGSMVCDNRAHFVPGLLVNQRRMDTWKQLIVQLDEPSIDRIFKNHLQIPLVIQPTGLGLYIVDPPAARIQFARDRQVRIASGRVQMKRKLHRFRIRAGFQAPLSTLLIAHWIGTVPTALLDFLPNPHQDFPTELVAEPFGQHALHLKVNNALRCAGVDVIIEANQPHAERIELCFHVELQAQIAHEAVEIHDNESADADALLLDIVQQALKRWAPIAPSTDAFLDVDASDIEATFCTERTAQPFLRLQTITLNLRLIGNANVDSDEHWKASTQCERPIQVARHRATDSIRRLLVVAQQPRRLQRALQ